MALHLLPSKPLPPPLPWKLKWLCRHLTYTLSPGTHATYLPHPRSLPVPGSLRTLPLRVRRPCEMLPSGDHMGPGSNIPTVCLSTFSLGQLLAPAAWHLTPSRCVPPTLGGFFQSDDPMKLLSSKKLCPHAGQAPNLHSQGQGPLSSGPHPPRLSFITAPPRACLPPWDFQALVLTLRWRGRPQQAPPGLEVGCPPPSGLLPGPYPGHSLVLCTIGV